MAVSLAGRAALAIALMVGFYALAIGLAAALLYLPYAEVVYAERFHLRLAIFCIGGAGVILWSVFPRRDHFEPPGPELGAGEHPRLFRELTGIARAVGQDMPAEAYLVPDVNAWVAQRGGVMGFGSRRVMGLGLPLMQLLTVAQFRAVLAHEFGHYHGGDTRLSPWVYKTRAAIGRTLNELSSRESILVYPFVWYANMFLRVTHAISRRQEFAADELAARTVGAQALIDGLMAIHRGAIAFPSYWSTEVAPVLEAGYRPPLADGFRLFLGNVAVSTAVSEHLEEELHGEQTDPYDTHPPLRERIAAVERLKNGGPVGSDPPAIELLENVLDLEAQLIGFLSEGVDARALKAVKWEEAGTNTLPDIWQRTVTGFSEVLKGLTPASLPEAVAELHHIGRKIPDPPGQLLTADERRERAEQLLGLALASALHRSGWMVYSTPGDFYMLRNNEKINPFVMVKELVAGERSAEAWRRDCAALGISDVELSVASGAKAAPS